MIWIIFGIIAVILSFLSVVFFGYTKFGHTKAVIKDGKETYGWKKLGFILAGLMWGIIVGSIIVVLIFFSEGEFDGYVIVKLIILGIIVTVIYQLSRMLASLVLSKIIMWLLGAFLIWLSFNAAEITISNPEHLVLGSIGIILFVWGFHLKK